MAAPVPDVVQIITNTVGNLMTPAMLKIVAAVIGMQVVSIALDWFTVADGRLDDDVVDSTRRDVERRLRRRIDREVSRDREWL